MNATTAPSPNLMSGPDFRESLRRYQPRVFVDGRKLFEQPIGENSARITLESGKHVIRVEYYEVGGPSLLEFSLRRL